MRTYTLTVEGRTFTIEVTSFSRTEADVEVDGTPYKVLIDDIAGEARPRLRTMPRTEKSPPAAKAGPPGAAVPAGAGAVTAPIPGMILSVLVKEGQKVATGAPLLKMEAMKMETVVSAAVGGTVRSIAVEAGDSVTQGQEMMVIG
jgi:glutaconyl-CoA/methylmalonyl-CoA decarboxylase subunit gamma